MHDYISIHLCLKTVRCEVSAKSTQVALDLNFIKYVEQVQNQKF